MDENETQVVETETVTETEETTTQETQVEKPKETPEARATRLLRQTNQARAKLGLPPLEEKTETKSTLKENTGDLDDNALLLLEVKGVKTDDADEMKLVDEWRDAGKSVKAMLTNKIFQAELKAIRDQKAVESATPSSTKRGGSQTADLASALAKFESTGALPDDFALRTQVVNALVDRKNGKNPSWHRK